MKTLVLLFLVLTASTFAQSPATPARKYYANPSDQSAADYAAAAERAYQERTAGMFARPMVAVVTFNDNTQHRLTILGVKSQGLIVQQDTKGWGLPSKTTGIPKEWLGLEDKVRFGYGTPEEALLVAKINAERERARMQAEQLELLRRQAEAQEAIAGELYRQEQNRLIFGR